MLKNILKLDGAQQLSKNEQKEVNGGKGCHAYYDCSEKGEGYSWSSIACGCVCESCNY
jgi:hypothetical protein